MLILKIIVKIMVKQNNGKNKIIVMNIIVIKRTYEK